MKALWSWWKRQCPGSVLLFVTSLVAGYTVLGSIMLLGEGHWMAGLVVTGVYVLAMAAGAASAANLEELVDALRSSLSAPVVPPS